MSVGYYGIKRPADVDPSDVEVIVIYNKTRASSSDQKITKLTGADVIKPIFNTTETGGSDIELLGGLYNLVLPQDVFNAKGYYTIYIRPAQIRMKIEDCSELATFPDVKGLVFNINTAPTEFINKMTNNGLDGYRIEYLNEDGSKIQNLFRIVTSSFVSEPVQANTANSSQKLVKYITSNVGNMLFCTVTPNTAPSFKPTSAPYIGKKDQQVIITNTNFSPQVIEIELVNYDIESLAISLLGEQSKSMDDGIYTLYDFDGNIYSQYDLYEIRDGVNKKLYEIRKKRTVIDESKAMNNITKNG